MKKQLELGTKVKVSDHYDVPYDYRGLTGKVTSFFKEDYVGLKLSTGASILVLKKHVKEI